MSGSFNRIDYSVRPSKYAERRMLRDIFRRLTPFCSPDLYRYVGFGSVWFADFTLFHRSLGVRDMISIESATSAEERVKDNAPFNINILMGRSEKWLPKIDWEKKQFLWLDYDDAIDANKVSDADVVSRKASSGTVYAATFRADAAKQLRKEETDTDIVDDFSQSFEEGLVPSEIFEDDLSGYPFAKLSRDIILAKIEDSLDVRNGTETDPMRFEPICAIDYADGCLMTTLVGVFFSESDRDKFVACEFEDLDFIGSLGDRIKIELPLMTPLEVRKIEKQLPKDDAKELDIGTIPPKQVERLLKYYRHFPSYMVAEN